MSRRRRTPRFDRAPAVGDRVRLVSTDDRQATAAPGAEGTVTAVQDGGPVGRVLHVAWDGARPQAVLPDAGDVVTVL